MKAKLLCASLLILAPALSQAQVSLIVQETELSAGDYDASGLAVGPTGNIYAVDTDSDDRLLRIIPGSPNTVEVITTITEVYAAIDAVNGSHGSTGANIRLVDVAADGDIVIVGFTNGATGDYVATVTDAPSGAVTVIYTGFDSTDSVLAGSSALTVIGNTAYISTDTNNGSTNALWSVDTNAGSLTTPTELVSQASLVTATGAAATDVGLNALANDGTDIWATVSATATAPDSLLRITTAGAVSVEITGASIVTALQGLDGTATDVGFGAITLDEEGDVWLANSFGDGIYADGFLQLSAISGGNATVGGVTAADIDAGTGSTGPFIGNDGIAWDTTNDRLIFSSGDVGGEGIGAYVPSSSVSDWTIMK